MKKNNVDCIKMVRKIRDNMYLKTKNMSSEEEIKYYKENSNLEKGIFGKKSPRKSA